MLLIASLDPRTEDERSTPTSTCSQKEIVSLPRLSQPPTPTEIPEIVKKSSTLSKSESCSTLGTISVENSTIIKSRSMSANPLDTAFDQKSESVVLQPPIGETNTAAVDKPHPTVTQTGTTVSDFGTTDPVSHQASIHTQAQLITSSVNSSDDTTLLRQEIGHELSGSHYQVYQQPPTHTPICDMSSSSQTASGLDHGRQEGRAFLAGEVQVHATTGSDFTEEEASSLACETYQCPTVEQHHKQTQPSLRLLDENAFKTGTLHTAVGSNSHSPTIPPRGEAAPCFTHHEKTESSDVALSHVRTMSPVNHRSPRLAAMFVHTQASASTFSGQHQSSRPFVNSTHTSQLSSLTLQSDLAHAVCPSLQPNKGGAFVGSRQSAEHTDTNGIFSGKEKNGESFIGRGVARKSMNRNNKGTVSCVTSTQGHQGIHTEGFGHSDPQLLLATTGNKTHLSSHTCQPTLETTQKNLHECQDPSPSLSTSLSAATD